MQNVINWGSLSVSNVDIAYSLDGSTNWQTIATNITSNDGNNSNYYDWAVSGIIGTNLNAKIRVSSNSDPNIYAISDAFTLADQAAGIVSNNKQKIINIYPNPTNGIVNIELSNQIITNIAISNISGSILLQEKGNSMQTQINISHLQQGFYFAKITTETGESITQKIVKD